MPQDMSLNPPAGESPERRLIDAGFRQELETPLEPADSDSANGDDDFIVRLPDGIPGYEFNREIHRGGQGVIYDAVQKSTRGRVAIKILREGPFASRRDQARFEREVHILARLKHANIVAIHDSGVVQGHFYYVMDYISGRPLSHWMADGPHSLEDTLKLFARICEAVNAAHLHGVIHRDLKPGNIQIDSGGEPHVLDFGLAKTLTGQVTSDSRPQVMTITGQFLGSVPWASPEQAEGVPEKIDIRSDVYSLGVILYQMLTGRFPYDVVGNMPEVLSRIMTCEPIPPGRAGSAVTGVRRRPPLLARFRRSGAAVLDDELETIVLKCLRKNRDDRYQSAGELGRDIRRYLAGEPIEAKRDSTLYVLRKSLRRHRAAALVGAGYVFLVTAGMIGFMVMSAREKTLRVAAESAGTQAIAARNEAIQRRDEADRHRAEAELHTYVTSIMAAATARYSNKPDMARKYLENAQPAHRSWEWNYLRNELDWSAPLWWSPTFHTLALSPDGKRLVTNSLEDSAQVWDVDTGEHLFDLTGHDDILSGLAFSSDGSRIVTGCDDGSARVWSAANGHRLAELAEGHEYEISCASFSPDGQLIVTGSHDDTARLWKAANGELAIPALKGHGDSLTCVAFSPDGRRVITGSLDRTAVVWDVVNGDKLFSLEGHQGSISAAAFSPDGLRIATASADNTVRLWDAKTGRPGPTVRHGLAVNAVAFSPDGARIVTGAEDNAARLWNTADGGELFPPLRGHLTGVKTVSFSPDGMRVRTGASDQAVRSWNPVTGEELEPRLWYSADARSAVFSPDGRQVVTASTDHEARLWDAATGHLIRTFRGHRGRVTSATFSPDGSRLLTGSTDKTIRLWSAATREITRAPHEGHTDAITSVAFCADGSLFMSGSKDKTVRLWETASGRERAPVLKGHLAAVTSVTFSPDGRYALTGSEDHSAWLWNVASGQPVFRLTGHSAAVTSVAFSSDGNRLLTGSDDKIARLWDARTGNLTGLFGGHTAEVTSVAFSPLGTRFITGSLDATARLWAPASGLALLQLPYDPASELLRLLGGDSSSGPGGTVSVAFSRDGSRLLTVFSSGRVRIWDSRPVADQEAERRDAEAVWQQARDAVESAFQRVRDWPEVLDTLQKDTSLSGVAREYTRNIAQERMKLEQYRKGGSAAEAFLLDELTWIETDLGSDVVEQSYSDRLAERRYGILQRLLELYVDKASPQPMKEAITRDLWDKPKAGLAAILRGPRVYPAEVVAGQKAGMYVTGEGTAFELMNVEGDVTVEPRKGTAPAEITVSANGKGLQPFRVRLSMGGKEASVSGALLATPWDVKFFSWASARPAAPPEDGHALPDEDGWKRVAQAAPLCSARVEGIDFRWPAGSPPCPGLDDYFGTVATTTVTLPAGRYQIKSLSDDGIRIWIDDQLLIEDWTWHAPKENSREVDLPEGQHAIRIEHFEIDGHAELRFGLRPVAAAEVTSRSAQESRPTSRPS